MNVLINRIEIKKEAKKFLDGKTWFMFLCNFLFLILVAAIGAVVYLVPNPLEKLLTDVVYENVPVIDLEYFEISKEAMQWICWGMYMFFRTLIFVALAYPFWICLATVPLAIVRERKVTVQSIFAPIKRARYFLEYAIAGLQRFITTFLYSLLLIVPGFFSHYKFSFSRYVFSDNNELTAGEALSESKKYTLENRESLFALDMSFVGWLIISIVTCGLGFIFAVSYHEISYALYYEGIKKCVDEGIVEEKPKEEPQKEELSRADSKEPVAETKAEGPVGTRFEPTDENPNE